MSDKITDARFQKRVRYWLEIYKDGKWVRAYGPPQSNEIDTIPRAKAWFDKRVSELEEDQYRSIRLVRESSMTVFQTEDRT